MCQLLSLVSIVYIFGTVFADDCADFCTASLGLGACEKSSWCKNEYDCHGLFWTSVDETSICVFSGDVADCPETLPVLCSQAKQRMAMQVAETAVSSSTTALPTTLADNVRPTRTLARAQALDELEIQLRKSVSRFVRTRGVMPDYLMKVVSERKASVMRRAKFLITSDSSADEVAQIMNESVAEFYEQLNRL